MHANTRFGWSFVPHHALRYRTNAEFIAESLSLAQHFGRRKVFRSRSIRVFARTFIFISFALSLVSVDGRRVSIPLAIYRFNLMLLQIVHAFGGDRRAKCTKLVDERWLMLGCEVEYDSLPFREKYFTTRFRPGPHEWEGDICRWCRDGLTRSAYISYLTRAHKTRGQNIKIIKINGNRRYCCIHFVHISGSRRRRCRSCVSLLLRMYIAN